MSVLAEGLKAFFSINEMIFWTRALEALRKQKEQVIFSIIATSLAIALVIAAKVYTFIIRMIIIYFSLLNSFSVRP